MERVVDNQSPTLLDQSDQAVTLKTKDFAMESQLGRETDDNRVELSVVLPCLNEAETVGICVTRTIDLMREQGIRGEVVVSDNGSTDGSIELAMQAGARVVHQHLPGYGNALIKGFDEAYGRYILMFDADNTYDIDDIPRFVELLREGYDTVIGNRFKGGIMPGAMPWLHQYVGNPVLSGILNFFFNTGVGDAHCGMRACTKEAYHRMHLQTGGMEFASEWVINAAKIGLKIAEVPTKYYPRGGESKLNTFQDGWRHLRFMLLYSPTHLFLWPGIVLMVIGFIALFSLAWGVISIAGFQLGVHWMFVGSLLAIIGFQLINLGFCARVFSLSSQIDHNRDRVVNFFLNNFRLESGILLGSILFVLGLFTFIDILFVWLNYGLETLQSIRFSILALTLSVIGVQMVFASFFVSMMVIKRRGWPQ